MTEKSEKYYQAVMEHKQISRRGLFRGLLSGAKKTQQQAVVEPFTRLVARPPTAVDETLLSRLCDGCGECEKACPQHVISMINGKPELHLDCNFCTDCGECQHACPTLALSNTCHSTGIIPVFSGSCRRMLYGYCDMCAADCPQLAIDLNEKRPAVLKDKCNGCGQCRTACPMGAISFTLSPITPKVQETPAAPTE